MPIKFAKTIEPNNIYGKGTYFYCQYNDLISFINKFYILSNLWYNCTFLSVNIYLCLTSIDIINMHAINYISIRIYVISSLIKIINIHAINARCLNDPAVIGNASY